MFVVMNHAKLTIALSSYRSYLRFDPGEASSRKLLAFT